VSSTMNVVIGSVEASPGSTDSQAAAFNPEL